MNEITKIEKSNKKRERKPKLYRIGRSEILYVSSTTTKTKTTNNLLYCPLFYLLLEKGLHKSIMACIHMKKRFWGQLNIVYLIYHVKRTVGTIFNIQFIIFNYNISLPI